MNQLQKQSLDGSPLKNLKLNYNDKGLSSNHKSSKDKESQIMEEFKLGLTPKEKLKQPSPKRHPH